MPTTTSIGDLEGLLCLGHWNLRDCLTDEVSKNPFFSVMRRAFYDDLWRLNKSDARKKLKEMAKKSSDHLDDDKISAWLNQTKEAAWTQIIKIFCEHVMPELMDHAKQAGWIFENEKRETLERYLISSLSIASDEKESDESKVALRRHMKDNWRQMLSTDDFAWIVGIRIVHYFFAIHPRIGARALSAEQPSDLVRSFAVMEMNEIKCAIQHDQLSPREVRADFEGFFKGIYGELIAEENAIEVFGRTYCRPSTEIGAARTRLSRLYKSAKVGVRTPPRDSLGIIVLAVDEAITEKYMEQTWPGFSAKTEDCCNLLAQHFARTYLVGHIKPICGDSYFFRRFDYLSKRTPKDQAADKEGMREASIFSIMEGVERLFQKEFPGLAKEAQDVPWEEIPISEFRAKPTTSAEVPAAPREINNPKLSPDGAKELCGLCRKLFELFYHLDMIRVARIVHLYTRHE